MGVQQSILLVSPQNLTVLEHIEHICDKNKLILYKIQTLAEAVDVLREMNNCLTVVEEEAFCDESEICSFININPNTILIGDHILNTRQVCQIKKEETPALEALILEKAHIPLESCFTKQVPFIRSTVERALLFLGFSRRYKGFDYLIEAIGMVLNNQKCNSSFSRYVYPQISYMYQVSVDSVERDIRHLINKSSYCCPNQVKTTNKNIVSAVVEEVKNYLLKLGNFKPIN